ncbi:MAG: glycerate kinase [Saprospiraceae bacterium]
MNILIAPNSFRGSLDAFKAADIIAKAFEEVSQNFEIVKIPIADGGDFTAEILVKHLNGYWKTVEVLNPLGKSITAKLGLTKSGVGIVELSEASGTRLIKDAELNPMITTTYGTGQLIKAALDEGCKKIIVCLGGSATNDGGVGLLQALGVQFLDNEGKEIGFGGSELQRIATIDESQMDSRVKKTRIVVPCDVGNYLLGEKGATKIFGSQKGATNEMMETLEDAMTHYSLKIWEAFRRDVVNLKHGGAAGGTAAGLWAFLNARLVLGSRYILNELHFDLAAEKADLIITAEGKLDNQTINGKAPFEVAMRAKRFKKTVIAIAGQTPSTDVQLYHGVFSLMNKPMSLTLALSNTEKLLYNTSFQIAKFYNQLIKPKPKAKSINKLLIINADVFGNNLDEIERIALTLIPVKEAEIPILLYSKRTYEEMIWLCSQLAIHQPFIVENGGALYVPNNYLKLDLKDFTVVNEHHQMTFGTTHSTIENITDKLAKVTGVNLDNDILSPLDLADYWDIELFEAERIMKRNFSQMIVKTEEVFELSDMFKQLVTQQGLQIIDAKEAYYIGNFSVKNSITYWIDYLKSEYADLQIFALSNVAEDKSILELSDEAFLLKYNDEWQPVLLENLNLINGSISTGLKQVVASVVKEKT